MAICASLLENGSSGFPTRSDAKQAVQPHKMARDSKFHIYELCNKRDCAIYEAKKKALISFTVTAKLNCVFVFAYA